MRHYIWRIKNVILSLLKQKTLGARAIVVKDNHILLVKHSYIPHWYLPGGGVDAGEHPAQSIKRELREETGFKVISEPVLFALYLNKREGRDDYIAIYTVNEWQEPSESVADAEVTEMRFFALDALPNDISPATLRRIQEYRGLKQIDIMW